MRKIFEWVAIAVIAVVFIMIGLSIQAKTNVSSENNDSLSNAIRDTISGMFENKNYSADDTDEFIADFIQGLVQKVESEAEVQVNVLKADHDKGLLSVEVVETYKQPNGKKEETSCIRTVVFDRQEIIEGELQTFRIAYYLSKDDMNIGKAYKEYEVLEGDEIPVPVLPETAGEPVYSWYSAKTNAQAVFEDGSGSPIAVTENASFYASN